MITTNETHQGLLVPEMLKINKIPNINIPLIIRQNQVLGSELMSRDFEQAKSKGQILLIDSGSIEEEKHEVKHNR